MISHKYKCIFIHIPKCAGTSIEQALGHFDNYDNRNGQDHRSIRVIEQPFPVKSAFCSSENRSETWLRFRYRYRDIYKPHIKMNPNIKLTVTQEQYNSYFKFTFIRNPWARAFSWYRNVMKDEDHKRTLKVDSDISLKDFLRIYSGKGMLKPQTYWLKSFDGSITLDYIGRFENLVEDFQKVCKAINIPQVTLAHKIKGTGEDYREFYDKEAIDMVSDIYREEIEMFDYYFDAPYGN